MEFATDVAEFAAELFDVAVGGTGQDACGRGIGFADANPIAELAHPRFQAGDAWLQIV